MILFTMVTLAVIIAALIAIVVTSTFGIATLAIFGDIIVCGLILGLIIKYILRKKR